MVQQDLSDYIRQFPDHRKHGVRYRMGPLILLTILGYLCGRDSLMGVWRFGKSLTKPQLKRLGFRDGKLPTHSALCTAFHGVDASALCEYLSQFILRNEPEHPVHLSIDGKRLRASRHGDHPGVHVISAFAQELHTVVGSVEMGSTNEATASLALLDRLELKGKIITGDAIFTRKDVCHKIVEKGGDYLLPVKDNNKPLKHAIMQNLQTVKKTTQGKDDATES